MGKIPRKRQYPLKPKALKGIQPLLSKFLKPDSLGPARPLQHSDSPCSEAQQGVIGLCKTYKQWMRPSSLFTQWYQTLNILLTQVPGNAECFSVWTQRCIFLYSPTSKPSILFHLWKEGPWNPGGYPIYMHGAFSGFLEGPPLCGKAWTRELRDLSIEKGPLLQYIDDSLISSETKQNSD